MSHAEAQRGRACREGVLTVPQWCAFFLREGDRPVVVAADGKLPAFGMYALLKCGTAD